MTTKRRFATAVICAFLAAPAACGNEKPSADAGPPDPAPTTTFALDPGDGGDYAPALDPASFSAAIDNPWYPLPVGGTWRYEGMSDGQDEVIDIVVTPDTRTVMGIEATVVRDTVTIDGELVEDTYDWFAQDADGNVWYLGEDVKDYENGKVVSTAGSWEAGVDGARLGIVMPADPAAGRVYRQEFLPGEAEDMMRIASTGGTLTTPAGAFSDVVTTEDWTPLEPAVVERKSYAAGIGKLREETTAGGDGIAELVRYRLP